MKERMGIPRSGPQNIWKVRENEGGLDDWTSRRESLLGLVCFEEREQEVK